MDINLTVEENRLVEYSKEAVIKYNKMRHKNGGIDTLYSFLLSDSGKIFDGHVRSQTFLMLQSAGKGVQLQT